MKVMGIIFSNIYDSSLGELTNHRTVASLPFGGRYRQIDFALSNMSNSGIYNIGIITKYNYRSLMDHLGTCSAWDLNRKNEGVVFLPPFAEGNMGTVYKGKLEALYSAIHFIGNSNYDYVVICDATVLCNIDFGKVIKHHIKSENDVTIISHFKSDKKKYPLILETDENDGVTQISVDAYPDANGSCVGMGMFVISRSMLVESIRDAYTNGYVHFERDYLQRKFNKNDIKLGVYRFDGTVLFNGDIESYYENNMALLNKEVRDGIFLKDTPIYTKVRDEYPAYYEEGTKISNCIIADGCVMRGRAEDSVIFREVVIEKDAFVKSSIIMQGAKIGTGAKLECVILDKNVTITEGTRLKGTPKHPIIIKKGEVV
jgi:glucose-1-phosphate adenylyltransferase